MRPVMDYHDNIAAYSNVENLSDFSNATAIQDYRNERLAAVAPAAAFVAKYGAAGLPVDVVEVGSGSSCLLYALAKMNVLRQGVGVEASESRHRFAEKWKSDDDFDSVQNLHGDFLDMKLGEDRFDVCLLVDNTFAYFVDEEKHVARRVADATAKLIRADGKLIVQVTCFPEYAAQCRTKGRASKWFECPPGGRHSYRLYEYSLNDNETIMTSRSLYIGTDRGSDSEKVEQFIIYDESSLRNVFAPHFQITHVFGSFDADPFTAGVSERIVIVARKESS